MRYEIRSFSVSVIPYTKTLGILMRNTSNNFYIHRTFELQPNTNVRAILNFLAENLKCTIKDITVASHVNFDIVGVSE